MTGLDWWEMSQMAYGNMADCFAMILTMASGYLVVAYLVGSKLTRTQVVAINVLFIWAMAIFTFLFSGFAGDGVSARGQAANMLPELDAIPRSWERPFAVATLLFSLAALVICLRFMSNVRRQPMT
jgi:hypothetical protein